MAHDVHRSRKCKSIDRMMQRHYRRYNQAAFCAARAEAEQLAREGQRKPVVVHAPPSEILISDPLIFA